MWFQSLKYWNFEVSARGCEPAAAWRFGRDYIEVSWVLFLALTMYFILHKDNGLSIQVYSSPMIMHKTGHNGVHFVLCTHRPF